MPAMNVVILASALLVFQVSADYYQPTYRQCLDKNVIERALIKGTPVPPVLVLQKAKDLKICLSGGYYFFKYCKGPIVLKKINQEQKGNYIIVNGQYSCCNEVKNTTITITNSNNNFDLYEEKDGYHFHERISVYNKDCYVSIGQNCDTKEYKVVVIALDKCGKDCEMKCYQTAERVAKEIGVKDFKMIPTQEFQRCNSSSNYY